MTIDLKDILSMKEVRYVHDAWSQRHFNHAAGEICP